MFQIRFYDVRKAEFKSFQPIRTLGEESVNAALARCEHNNGRLIHRKETGLPRFEVKNEEGKVIIQAFPKLAKRVH